MRDAQPSAIYLKDYQPPAWWIDATDLSFELHEDHALVESSLKLRRNSELEAGLPLELVGQELELLEIEIDGETLDVSRYQLDSEFLRIDELPAHCTLRTVARIQPQDNTSLEGLYKSRTMFCTQCEAEGFRKITWYLDRPDVMSVFSVRVSADKARYPVLLSNGNLLQQGEEGDRHWTHWHDPFPKPSYLFALVAGDLDCVEDQFETCSGRSVNLRIYVETKDVDKCGHAMLALQNSMRWDEQRFGREYDLDLFNIVAVDDFNMGAMENKSLNIFNTSCVLAHADTTTDQAFQRVEAIVAHEYFHNWSGNRVTCRDWFQLSLKEGFTVYRDAEFSSDMGSRTVKRVEDVALLRTVQFAEDAGPMAHPVRPESFIEISNFYTVTIYEKGAEVVRMIATLLGPEDFRKGTDLYFERHDGQAVTCEDFVLAMEAASGRDLGQFRRWYSQAGTPRLQVHEHWDEASREYQLTFVQSCPATPDSDDKQPFVIPVELGLLGDAGALPLHSAALPDLVESDDNTTAVLELTQAEQTVTFTGLPERPVPSLMRGFSAPVKLNFDYSREQLAFLMSHDEDGFCRWDAAQQLAVSVIHEAQDETVTVDPLLLDAYSRLLADTQLDPAMVAEMLRLPSENYLAEIADSVDVFAIHRGRQRVRAALCEALAQPLMQRYQELTSAVPYQPSAEQIADRSLRNSCLAYLACTGDEEGLRLARQQFDGATNMTDQQAALVTLVNNGSDSQRQQILDEFYEQWRAETLVVNQWFQVQALCPDSDNLGRVQKLMQHPEFDLRNPNKVRAVIGAFCSANPVNFHQVDGAGYQFLADQVLALDALNPQIASRLLGPLTKWRRYAQGSQLMRAALERVAASAELSRDVYEVVSKSLRD